MEKVKKIVIFDFDQTLVNTPTPEMGKSLYKEKTGEDWPHKGWWGRKESLDMDVFEMPVTPSVMAAYKSYSVEPNTIMVMLTGRLDRLSGRVEKVLYSKGLRFDHCLYNTGGDTLSMKLATLDNLLALYPEAESIHMFEDRELHVAEFRKWGESKKDRISFEITTVKCEEEINP